MLDPFSRGAIVMLSALSVAATLSLAPIRARSSIDSGHLALLSAPMPVAANTVPIEAIRRDPFAMPTATQTQPAHDVSLPPPARRFAGDEIEPLPSNVGDDAIPAVPGSVPQSASDAGRVTAVVTGAHPYAMVNTRGVHEIKGIGDLVDGSAVIAIDMTGIRLQNGTRLTVDAADRP